MKYGRTGQCRVCGKTQHVRPATQAWDLQRQRYEKTSVAIGHHTGANGGVCPGSNKPPR